MARGGWCWRRHDTSEPQAREPWRWLRPPWETPPLPPKPAVWQFLQEHIPAALLKPEVQSWEEIYRMIAPHSAMLQTLLMPPTSQDRVLSRDYQHCPGAGVQ